MEETFCLVLRKYTLVRNRYKEAYLKWRDNRWQNIYNLQLIIDALENTRNNCNIASLGGGCAGLVGGLLTGAGLICLPFTVGASTPLIIAGASLAVSGGATGFGAGMADMKLSKNKCKEAQLLINTDVELTIELLIKEKEYAQCLEEVEQSLMDLQAYQPENYNKLTHYLSSGMSTIGGATRFSTNIVMMATVARSLYLARLGCLSLTTTKVIGQVNPLSIIGAARVVDSMDDAVEAGSQVGFAAMRGAKAGFAAAAVLCVVGLAMDITSIIYTSRQIHVYRKQQIARSTSTVSMEDGKALPNEKAMEAHELDSKRSSLQENNLRIYLKSINQEMNVKSQSNNDLCSLSKYPTTRGYWEPGKCVDTLDIDEGLPLSKKISDSWEQVNITADMLIEVEEECPFANRTLSLEFEPELLTDSDMGSVTTTDDCDGPLLPDNKEAKTKENILRKVKHSFTRDYISERAERLKSYVRRLETEAMEMEKNPTLMDMVNQCSCKQCTLVGGGSKLYCCQDKRLYWNSVGNNMTETHNTPSLCVTQHPQFTDLYLNATRLEEEFQQHKYTVAQIQHLPRHRLLRYYAYHLLVHNCWGNNDITIKIPDCVHRIIINNYQADTEDFWSSSDGFGLKDLWLLKEDNQCILM